MTVDWRLLFVVYVMRDDVLRRISAREATKTERKRKERLSKDHSTVTISLRMPEDVVEDQKRIAPQLGFSGYQPLIKAYVGQGLRADLQRLEEGSDVAQLVENLRRKGIDEAVLSSAVAELQRNRAA